MAAFDHITKHLELHQQAALSCASYQQLRLFSEIGNVVQRDLPCWDIASSHWKLLARHWNNWGRLGRRTPEEAELCPTLLRRGTNVPQQLKMAENLAWLKSSGLKTEYIMKMKCVNLPLEQTGMLPFHCPYSLQISVTCSLILYPSSQEKL